jgi:putative FmdB family regulatory protein
VPSYDVRCRACGTTFEIKRSMAQADDPAPCPHGHDDTVRLLPTIAVTGLAASKAGNAAPMPACGPGGPGAGGGCCGGGGCGA